MLQADGGRMDGGNGEPTSVDIDTVLRVLADPSCRFIVRELSARPDHVLSFQELLGAHEDRDDADQDEASFAIQCHHAHLPVLEDAGVVGFDRTAGDVRYYEDPFVEALLDFVERWDA